MAGRRFSLLVLALLAAAPVWGQAPETSLRPQARPGPSAALGGQNAPVAAPAGPGQSIAEAAAPLSAAPPSAAVAAAVRAALAPPPRPAGTLTIAEAAAVETAIASASAEAERARSEAEARPAAAERVPPAPPVAATPAAPENPLAVASSRFPRARSASVVARYAALATERSRARAAAAAAPPIVAAAQPTERTGGPSQRGLCGVPGLQGRPLSSIRSSTQGCGVAEPVSVTSVQGIPLSMAATVDCTTAAAFDSWVRTQALPALGNTGGGVTQIRVAAHYACRPRNNQRGARVSEHGRGRAIDVSGFRLRNGEVVTVLEHYRRGPYRRAMQRMYAGACGIFRTTLGPDADRFHQDHFHFDMAQHRNNGTYCR